MNLKVLEKRKSINNAHLSVAVYEAMRRGVYVGEDLEAYRDIMGGAALYPVTGPRLYTAVVNKEKKIERTHPFSQATQYFIDKYGYPSGLKMFVVLHIPPPAREQILLQIDREAARGR